MLKGIITEQDWFEFKELISIDFLKDSHFAELKDNEILRERVDILGQVDQYIGTYFSKDWVRKNILMQTESDVQQMTKEISAEKASGEIEDEEDVDPADLEN